MNMSEAQFQYSASKIFIFRNMFKLIKIDKSNYRTKQFH